MKKELRQYLDTGFEISNRAFIKRFCGEKIGSGVYRTVYQLKGNSKYVVKVQPLPAFENNMEWNIWCEILQSEDLKKYFAPVHWKNKTGSILIMEKIKILKRYPGQKYVPNFLKDRHKWNYGYLKGQLVCCDYGSTPITFMWNVNRVVKF